MKREIVAFEEFIVIVKNRIAEMYKDRAEVEIKELQKNNNISLTALLIKEPGINMVPSIYLNSFYQLYNEDTAIEECCELICDLYENQRVEKKFDIEKFLDYEWVKTHISIRLINTQENKNYLENLPHRDYLNLSIIYVCIIENEIFGEGCVVIKNEHLSSWKASEKDLYEAALRNKEVYMKPFLKDIGAYIEENIKMFHPLPEAEGIKSGMSGSFILSNERLSYGAGVIVYPGYLENLANELDCDFYIIPSSVHEVILFLKTNNDNEQLYLKEMIKEVNAAVVMKEEFLSNELYEYSRKSGRMTVVV